MGLYLPAWQRAFLVRAGRGGCLHLVASERRNRWQPPSDIPAQEMKILLLVSLAVIAMLIVAGCTGIAFTAANVPALFGDFERHANVAYGTGEREHVDVYSPKGAQGRP